MPKVSKNRRLVGILLGSGDVDERSAAARSLQKGQLCQKRELVVSFRVHRGPA